MASTTSNPPEHKARSHRKGQAPERPALDDVLGALSHPLRRAILAEMVAAERSPKDLAPALGNLGTLSYHFRELQRYRCIELVRTIPRRGALQHVYSATVEVEARPDGAGWSIKVTPK